MINCLRTVEFEINMDYLHSDSWQDLRENIDNRRIDTKYHKKF